MIENLKKEWSTKIAFLVYIILTIWWFVSPSYKTSVDTRFIGDFSSIYVVMALLGAYWGIQISRKWGGTKSILGKAILFFSLSLLSQVFGQITYFYFSFILHVAVPYPSLGDIGYFGSIPLYILGIYYLAIASGIKISPQLFIKKPIAIVIPLFTLFSGYILFLKGYTFDLSGPLKIFLDLGYPLGDAIYVSLAILTYLLTRKVLGGIMKSKILFILFALCCQFITDYTFLFQSSRGIWSSGGINDYMYLTTYFVLTLALLQFKTIYDHLRSK